MFNSQPSEVVVETPSEDATSELVDTTRWFLQLHPITGALIICYPWRDAPMALKRRVLESMQMKNMKEYQDEL